MRRSEESFFPPIPVKPSLKTAEEQIFLTFVDRRADLREN